jgi:hypothetical protein
MSASFRTPAAIRATRVEPTSTIAAPMRLRAVHVPGVLEFAGDV